MSVVFKRAIYSELTNLALSAYIVTQDTTKHTADPDDHGEDGSKNPRHEVGKAKSSVDGRLESYMTVSTRYSSSSWVTYR